MRADMPTLLMMLIAASATLTFSVGWVARRDAKDGLSLWSWGLSLNTLALVLLGLRGIAPDFLSIIVANMAISGSYALFLGALLQLQGRNISSCWFWAPPLSIAGSFLLFMPDVHSRIIISGAVFCAQQVMILCLMMTPGHVIKGHGKHLLICAFTIMILTISYRTSAVAFGTVIIVDVTQNATIQVLLFVASFVSLVLGSNGFVLMAKEHADERFRMLAQKDTLTGTWNRAYMQEIAWQEMSRHNRYGHPISLVMADLDYFKEINDRFGHAAGDLVLKEFCKVVLGCVRSSDAFGRWGGEEFLLILPNSSLSSAAELAERIRHGLEGHIFSDVRKVTASFGVAEYRPEETWEQWLNRADLALYRAKAAGRNKVEMEEIIQQKLELQLV
jgi:diguanylate cyclase (GGDEF)-like protein